MTDLDKLYAVMDGKTRGPWEISPVGQLPTVKLPTDVKWRANIPEEVWTCDDPLDGCDEVCHEWKQNAVFIAAMGTLAPEIKALIQAAEKFLKRHGPSTCALHYECDEAQQIESALAALKAKVPAEGL